MKILYHEIPWIDPFDAFILLKGEGPSFLLESLGGGTKTSRYSFIGTNPGIIIKCKGNHITISYRDHAGAIGNTLLSEDPFLTIRQLIMRGSRVMGQGSCQFPLTLDPCPLTPLKGLPPFIGGAVGYIGYDMVHLFEKLPRRACDDLQLPDMVFMIADVIVALDHVEKRGWIIAVPDKGNERDEEFKEQIREIEQKIRRGGDLPCRGRYGLKIKIVSNLTRKEYIDMVSRCKEYISSGDIFQANLSQRLSAHIKGVDPLSIYKVLREVNPSPFSAFIDTGEVQIVSSSPERLVRLQNGLVETRPIAGTRPRGRDHFENERLQRDLLTSEKERAEHIMLVDLERNDIGRVCRYGSIRVDEFMVLESYSYVTHIVSNMAGEIESDKDAIDLIRAVFPGGTITGVPKIRCMEIIDELEPTARGPYTGSIGYISYTGNVDLNIIIRSFIIKDGWAHVQVGAGIVADSDPEKEYFETLYKAEALIKTLELV